MQDLLMSISDQFKRLIRISIRSSETLDILVAIYFVCYLVFTIGVFEGWQRGALPLLNLFLPPLKIFNDAVQQADNEVSKAQNIVYSYKMVCNSECRGGAQNL